MRVDPAAGTVTDTLTVAVMYDDQSIFPGQLVISWSRANPLVYLCTWQHPVLDAAGHGHYREAEFQLPREVLFPCLGNQWPIQLLNTLPELAIADVMVKRTDAKAVVIGVRDGLVRLLVGVGALREVEGTVAQLTANTIGPYLADGMATLEALANGET